MSLLTDAEALIHGDREKDYGHPLTNFTRIAKMWSAYRGVDFTPTQVADMMALLKFARLANDPDHRDSRLDALGYTAMPERFLECDSETSASSASGA